MSESARSMAVRAYAAKFDLAMDTPESEMATSREYVSLSLMERRGWERVVEVLTSGNSNDSGSNIVHKREADGISGDVG